LALEADPEATPEKVIVKPNSEKRELSWSDVYDEIYQRERCHAKLVPFVA